MALIQNWSGKTFGSSFAYSGSGRIVALIESFGDGHSLVVYATDYPGEFWYAQVVDATGVDVGPRIAVNAPRFNTEQRFSTSRLENGDIHLVWTESSVYDRTGSAIVREMVISSDHSRNSEPTTVLEYTSTSPNSDIRVAALGDGNSLVTYIQRDGDGLMYDVMVGIRGKDTTTPDKVLFTRSLQNEFYTPIGTSLGNESYLIAWVEHQKRSAHLNYLVLNADGNPSGEIKTIATHLAGGMKVEFIEEASNGSAIIGWSKIGSYSSTLAVTLVDESGGVVRTVQIVDATEAVVSAEELNDGRIAVVWVGGYQGKRNYQLSVVGKNGEVGTTTVLEFSKFVPLEDGMSITESSTGELLLATKAKQLSVSGTTMVYKYKVLSFDPNSFVATIKDDEWVGGNKADNFKGLAGDDKLWGGQGKDQLYGGDGNDTLGGGTSTDRLDGANGTDTASYFYDALGAVVALDGSKSIAGSAKGDKLFSIENLSGSNAGNDWLAGDEKVNVLHGNGGDDRLYGRAGTDTLYGGRGADNLFGGDGNDSFFGDLGSDTIHGGRGTDTINFFNEKQIRVDLANPGTKAFPTGSGVATGDIYISVENLIGTDKGHDRLTGAEANNTIWGNGGDDYIRAMEGADSVYGGKGDDILHGGTGADLIDGGLGVDMVAYYFDAPVNASLDGSIAGTGAAAGDKYVSIVNIGGSNTGADILAGNTARNFMYGNGGNDTLYGRSGSDILEGGKGADTLDGGFGFDYASYYDDAAVKISLDGSIAAAGTALGDKLISIEALIGSDIGSDELVGNADGNFIYGEGGDDNIKGKDGFDDLFGGAGRDKLAGGNGDDIVAGGLGRDRLSGGAGSDRFYIYARNERGDTILDFEAGDKIALKTYAFNQIFFNSFQTSMYAKRADNVAQDANDFLIFNTTDHSLWFDSDGNKAATPMLLCTFANDYVLRFSDIDGFTN